MADASFSPQQTKVRGVADLVVCLDITGSMGPCISKIKETIGEFVAALETPCLVEKRQLLVKVSDWRVRLLAYRDLNVQGEIPAMVEDFSFVDAPDDFIAQLEDPRIKAKGGGGDGPESTLDAVYRAARDSDWRPAGSCHRFVLVFTDALTLPLHPDTIGDGMPTDVEEVLQILSAQRVKPVVFGPRCIEYERLVEMRPEIAAASRLFDSHKLAMEFLKGPMEPFKGLMADLGRTISMSMGEMF